MVTEHADDAAVPIDKESNSSSERGNSKRTVKYKRAQPGSTARIDINTARAVLDSREVIHFWSRVDRGAPEICWPWLGGKLPKGYGMSHVKSNPVLAHRLAYVLAVGEIPLGLIVRHKCDNPPCCNPAHLELGTYQDNERDKLLREMPDEGLMLVVEAAEELGISPKRLRGRIFRNDIEDPIGDMSYVYRWCIDRMKKKAGKATESRT